MLECHFPFPCASTLWFWAFVGAMGCRLSRGSSSNALLGALGWAPGAIGTHPRGKGVHAPAGTLNPGACEPGFVITSPGSGALLGLEIVGGIVFEYPSQAPPVVVGLCRPLGLQIARSIILECPLSPALWLWAFVGPWGRLGRLPAPLWLWAFVGPRSCIL